MADCPSSSSHKETVPDELIDAVLDHIARYRLTVFPALQQLPVFAACGPRRIKNVLRECQRQSLIGSAPLHHGARYWYLDVLGAQACELPEERVGPLSEPAKIRALAMLRFCCLSDRPRRRLTPEELAAAFPVIAPAGLPSGYYFDPGGAGRLGLCRVDAGRSGRWDRVVESVRQDILQHLHRPGFRQFIQAGRFEITVLTVFRQKAKRIYESLLREAERLPLQVVALPELLPLIA